MAYTQYRSPFGDTTYTKVFVGGLAWETQTEEMRKYFEQFGDILEAVIITDKNTGRSKGYGFVTFRDPESAKKACIDPNPVIDGRKANCNIASFGRPRSSPPQGRNQGGTLYRGVVSMGNATSYNRAAGPQMTSSPSPPQPALSLPQVVYPPYGYTTYAPDYGYTQTMYSPQLQAQYYHQMYGAAAAASAGTSTCSTGMSGMGMGMGMASPYYYGFALPSATAAPPSLTFSAHRQSQNMAGPSYFPLPSATATATATATSTITTHEDTSLITFPPPALSNSTPSLPSSTTTTISDSRTAQEQNSATAETGVVGSEVEEGREQG